HDAPFLCADRWDSAPSRVDQRERWKFLWDDEPRRHEQRGHGFQDGFHGHSDNAPFLCGQRWVVSLRRADPGARRKLLWDNEQRWFGRRRHGFQDEHLGHFDELDDTLFFYGRRRVPYPRGANPGERRKLLRNDGCRRREWRDRHGFQDGFRGHGDDAPFLYWE